MITGNPNMPINNANLNALGSQYAALNGWNTTDLLRRIVNEMIYETEPQKFPLLKFLSMNPIETINSDEHFWEEMGWQRNAIQTTTSPGGVVYPAVQTVGVSSINDVSKDMIVGYPNGETGIVKNINIAGLTIDVQPRNNATLPAVVAGDLLAFIGTIEADGAQGFQPYFRAQTITRFNFNQSLPLAIKFGKIELEKYKRAGQFNNFISLQYQKFYQQARVSLENTLFQGIRGQFMTAGGDPAKTTGGIDYWMGQAGSPSVTSPVSTLGVALEQLVMDTTYELEGATKFLFGTSRQLRHMSAYFKDSLTRYSPKDMNADLDLESVKIGGTRVVFVDYSRFEDNASFPKAYAKRLYLLDLQHLHLKEFMPPEFGTSLNRQTGLPVNKEEMWIVYQLSMEIVNPLAWGKIIVQ